MPLPSGFSPEHYLRARLQFFYVVGLAIGCLTAVSIVAIATFSRPLASLNATLSSHILGTDIIDTSALGSEKISSQDDISRPAHIQFVNQSNEVLRIYWFDQSGVPVFYSQVGPGAEYWVDTYFESQWVVTTMDRKAVARFTPTSDNTRAVIKLTT